MKTPTKINQDSEGKPLTQAELDLTPAPSGPKVFYTDYAVLYGRTQGDLVVEVKEYLAEGWVPLGAVLCHHREWTGTEVWYQTVVKPALGL